MLLENAMEGDRIVWKLANFTQVEPCAIDDICTKLILNQILRVLFWYLFPSLLRNSGNKHQNNPLVSAETVRHSSTYIILYLYP